MANDTIITVIGNLTADPELRFTPNGVAVANFTVASTPRTFDRQSNEWKDGEALFMRSTAWREMAENVAASLTKGMRVIAQGRLKATSYTDREGNQRTGYELDVDEIGPALRFATAQVTRAQQGGGGQRGGGQQSGGGQQGGGFGGQQGGGFGGPPAASRGGQGTGWGQGGGSASGGQSGPQDPWSGGGWDTPTTNEPPF